MTIFDSYEKKSYEPYAEVIVPKGKIDTNVESELQKLCKMTSEEVKETMIKVLKINKYKIYKGKDFVFGIPKEKSKENRIILTAHYDTVQDESGSGNIYVEKINNKTYLWGAKGIGGDDRCGIGIIKELVENNYKPTILLCDKEESGGIGSEEFIEKYNQIRDKDEYSYILELDRKGENELVYYEENNKKFKKAIKHLTGGKEENGTFSDICNLYDMKIASVNLSVGYYNQHTKKEYIVAEEYRAAIQRVAKIISSMFKKFKHVEENKITNSKDLYNYCGNYYDDYYDSYYGYSKYYSKENNSDNENDKLAKLEREKIPEWEIGIGNDFVNVNAKTLNGAIMQAVIDYGISKQEIVYCYNCEEQKIEYFNSEALENEVEEEVEILA